MFSIIAVELWYFLFIHLYPLTGSLTAIFDLDLLCCFDKALKRKSGGTKSAEQNTSPGCSSVIKVSNQMPVLRKAGKPQKVPRTVKIGSHIVMENVGESLS